MSAMERPSPRRVRSARRARGVALLLVLVVLILVATLATEIALTARTHYKLSQHAMNEFLLRSVIEGRRQILLKALAFDATLGDTVDTEKDPWSWWGLKQHGNRLSFWGDAGGEDEASASDGSDDGGTRRVYRNKDVKFIAWCECERGKVNLRGLLWEEDSPTFINTRAALARLIDVYRDKWPSLDVSDSDAQQMVDDLVEWVRDKEDSEENPQPPTKARQGRLQALEEVFRVPGGRWRPELCYDVRDPRQTEEGDFSRQFSAPEATEEESSADEGDTGYSWDNGSAVPGLFRYVTVWGEGTAGTQPKINLNTAPLSVLRALFEPDQEEHAQEILNHRRAGADPTEGTASASGSGSGSGSSDGSSGDWFKQKQDLTKVEGLGDDLGRYPRLDFFAETKSSAFSIRIVATMTTGRSEGDEEDDTEPKDIVADYQYREVVQRTQAGFVSMFAERRHDPLMGGGE